MLTIKAEIKRSELKVDGTYNVKIRFTLDRKVKRLSTNLFVTQQDLTKSLKFKEDTSIKREIDRLVLYYREQCLKLQLDQNHYSLDEIIEFLNGEQEKQQTIDFIKFSREWIASTTIKGAPNYTTAINALVRFVGKEELDINLITLDFLEQFKAFLIGERDARTKKLMQQGKRVTSNRTLSLYLVSIKKLFNEAKRKFNKKDKNLILIPNSPFEDFKIPKQEATRKRAIPACELLFTALVTKRTARAEELYTDELDTYIRQYKDVTSSKQRLLCALALYRDKDTAKAKEIYEATCQRKNKYLMQGEVSSDIALMKSILTAKNAL